MDTDANVWIEWDEPVELINAGAEPSREDLIRRFPVPPAPPSPLRISAEISTEGVTGVPGSDCSLFCNLEYGDDPIFWDTFLYPDTGATPWRRLSCECHARGRLTAVELHIRFRLRGRLRVRNLRVEAIPAWHDGADLTVAVFGDSTDMTCYLPYEHRLTRRLELLLRDRFADHRVDVHGLAEGGEYLDRLVDSGRLERELGVFPRCDIVMFRYGLNDVSKGVTPDAFRAKLLDALDITHRKHPAAQIVLSTTIPANCDGYDEQARSLARERRLPLIDINDILRRRSAVGDWDWHDDTGHHVGRRRDQTPADNPTGLKGDKHPNLYGSALIAEIYYEHLEPLAAKMLNAP